MTKSKTIFDEDIDCPFCNKKVHVKAIKETVTEPISGEYETVIETNKSTQSKLDF